MSEEKPVIKASLVSLEVPESIDTAAKNLSGPLTESAGQFFKDVIDLVTGSFHAHVEKKRLNWQFGIEQLKIDLQHQLARIPEEKRSAPSLQITAQAIQDSLFSVEITELRKMFVNLLTSSVDADKSDMVHPSFSGIIRRMTPDDANVLMRFKERSYIPIVNYRLVMKQGHSNLEENVMYPKASPNEIKRISRSLVVLQSFGLIRLDYDRYLTADGIYAEFDQSPMIVAKENLLVPFKATNPLVKDIDYQKGVAELTSFGRQFVDVCT